MPGSTPHPRIRQPLPRETKHTYLTSSCDGRDPLRPRPYIASHHAPRTAGVAPNSTGLIRPPHTRKRRLANDEGAARTPVVHPGFCLCTPYLLGPRSTYDVAAPIAARHKTVYVGCEADTWWRSTASATATDSVGEWVSVGGQCRTAATTTYSWREPESWGSSWT